MRKVEAQQARRILDRLVGFQVSPLLWKPIRPGLSAGRVQTVALRLITEREDEIRAFVPEEYWSITAHLEAKRTEVRGQAPPDRRPEVPDRGRGRGARVLGDVDGLPFVVDSVKRRERHQEPAAAVHHVDAPAGGGEAARLQRPPDHAVAQQLYEGVDLPGGAAGLITYMRTDSTRISAGAAGAARDLVGQRFGDRYLPGSPRLWGGKQQKAAQEAHEAIRPTEPARTPGA
jgi:DNA topoisomerase I